MALINTLDPATVAAREMVAAAIAGVGIGTATTTTDPVDAFHNERQRAQAVDRTGPSARTVARAEAKLAAIEHARHGLVIVATPMSALAEMLRRLPADAPGVLWLCKGFQEGGGVLGAEPPIDKVAVSPEIFRIGRSEKGAERQLEDLPRPRQIALGRHGKDD